MLGRTRPASRLLLWPRSTTPARFSTTAPKLSHEATAESRNASDSKDVGEDDGASSPRKVFGGIRKHESGLRTPAGGTGDEFSIRFLPGTTEPRVPKADQSAKLGAAVDGDNPAIDPWAKLEAALGNAKPSGSRARRGRLPPEREVATTAWTEIQYSERRVVKSDERHERDSEIVGKENVGTDIVEKEDRPQDAKRLEGTTFERAAGPRTNCVGRQNSERQLVKSDGHHDGESQTGRGDDRPPAANSLRTTLPSTSSQVMDWHPFRPNPELVAQKAPIPSQAQRFAFNPDLAAKRLQFGLPTPGGSPPSLSHPQTEDVEPSQAEDDTPDQSSNTLGTIPSWGIPSDEKEASSDEVEAVPDDGAPPRSEIIRMMKTWNYEPEPVTEAEPIKQEEVDVTPSPPVRGKKAEQLPPLDREFRDWLLSASEEAIHEAEQSRTQTNNLTVYNGPTVLVLNGASKTLLPSDFYRVAGQGKHLGDWAVGIARIVQARHPATYEPLGKYYIFFETRAAALAYKDEVTRLQLLSRGAAHLVSNTSQSSSDSVPGPLPLAPEEPEPALRGYTLLPHSAMLLLKLYQCKDLPLPAEDTLSSLSQDLTSSSSSYLSQDHHFVLINIEGARTTVAALHAAIDRDGEERRVPWGLAEREDGKPSIAAVVPGSDKEEDEFSWDNRAPDDPSARFWRFIVPFTDATEARRFVRNWHRREMKDIEGRDMVMVFNAIALW
ncbi:hypothetical protein GE09DRAFT_1096157 [Coniochaeta sp. 2T2.1]|nr:hypothetical protein GE09DRAFT_1096157 [Coniochaeta sp. 2T2.1]